MSEPNNASNPETGGKSEGSSCPVGEGAEHMSWISNSTSDAASREQRHEESASSSSPVKSSPQNHSESQQEPPPEPKSAITEPSIRPIERTASNSSSAAVPDRTDTAASHSQSETFVPPKSNQNDKNQPNLTAHRLSSDSMSIGSTPSGLDSVGGVSGCVGQQVAQSQPPSRFTVGAALQAATPTPPPATIQPQQNYNYQQQQQQQQQPKGPINPSNVQQQGLHAQTTQQTQQQPQSIPMAPRLNHNQGPAQNQGQSVPESHPPVPVPVPLEQIPVQSGSQQVPQPRPAETGPGQQYHQHQQQQQQQYHQHHHQQQQHYQQQYQQQQHPQSQPQRHAEQTLYYQIPSVVNIVGPQESQPGMMNPEQQQYPTGLQHPNLPQQPMQEVPMQNQTEQVIGMVGAIPIVKLQTGSLHLVKKKKGRFKLLGDTPAVATAPMAAGAPVVGVVSSPSAATQQQLPTNTLIPTNIAIPTQGRSMSSAVSQLSAVMPAPQTFDGTSAPTVKKKGRFVVTNVKDPGSIPLNIQNPQTQPPSGVSEATGQQLPASQSQQQPNQRDTAQNQPQNLTQPQVNQREHVQNHAQSGTGTQNIAQPERVIPSLPATIEIQQGQQGQVNAPMAQAPGPQAVYAYQTPTIIHQPATFYQWQQVGGPQYSMADPVQPPPPPPRPPPAHNVQVDNNNFVQPQTAPGMDQTRAQSGGPYSTPQSTPPATPSTGASAPNSPKGRTQPGVPVGVAPAMPKAPTVNTEKARNPAGTRKKPTQGGTSRVPQSIDRNGNVSGVGLGKVFYLLDQMKTEVTGADRTIKTLQTDMKLLRDKNKELEAKVRELEAKAKEERALREKAETRCMELRKRIRDSKGETAGAKAVDQPAEGRSKEQTAEKSVIADVGKDKVTNGITANTKTAGTSVANSQTASVGGGHVAGGDKPRVPVQQKAASLPVKGAAPPLPTKQNVTTNSRPPSAPSETSQNKSMPSPAVTTKHVRSHSYNPDTKSALNRTTNETTATPSKSAATPGTRPNENSGQVPARSSNGTVSQNGPSAHKPQCISDFDPLKSDSRPGHSNQQSEMMPVISLSTPVSLEAVPLNSSPAFFQNTNQSTYANSGPPFATQFNTGPFLSDNQYVFPITWGMAPATVGQGMNGDIQQSPPNTHTFHGLQEQPIMVFPQQQPIMFQQVGGMQPVSNTIAGDPSNHVPMHQNPYQSVHTNENQPQAQSPSHAGAPNPFDAFSADPFDDLVPRHPPNQQ